MYCVNGPEYNRSAKGKQPARDQGPANMRGKSEEDKMASQSSNSNQPMETLFSEREAREKSEKEMKLWIMTTKLYNHDDVERINSKLGMDLKAKIKHNVTDEEVWDMVPEYQIPGEKNIEYILDENHWYRAEVATKFFKMTPKFAVMCYERGIFY